MVIRVINNLNDAYYSKHHVSHESCRYYDRNKFAKAYNAETVEKNGLNLWGHPKARVKRHSSGDTSIFL